MRDHGSGAITNLMHVNENIGTYNTELFCTLYWTTSSCVLSNWVKDKIC
jgi:hypothetical protein